MAFSKYDLDAIKSKLSLSTEIEKKTNVIKKGKFSNVIKSVNHQKRT